MSPLDPAELSALLDGELNAARAREIEVILESDAGVRAEYEALKWADVTWRAAGGSAAFDAGVRLPGAKSVLLSARNVTAMIIVLVGGHMAAKLLDGMAVSLMLNAALFGVVAAGVLAGWGRREALEGNVNLG